TKVCGSRRPSKERRRAPRPPWSPPAPAPPAPANGAAPGDRPGGVHAPGRGGRRVDPGGVPGAAGQRRVRHRGDPAGRRGARRPAAARPLPGRAPDRAWRRLLRGPPRPDRPVPPAHRGPGPLPRRAGRAGPRGRDPRGGPLLRHRRRPPGRAGLVGPGLGRGAGGGPGTRGPPAGRPPMAEPGTMGPPPRGAATRPVEGDWTTRWSIPGGAFLSGPRRGGRPALVVGPGGDLLAGAPAGWDPDGLAGVAAAGEVAEAGLQLARGQV